MKNIKLLLLFLVVTLTLPSCKDGWLDARPNKSLVVPETIADYQALLDNSVVMNTTPGLGELACDDYYRLASRWSTATSLIQKNAYIWLKDDIFGGGQDYEWPIRYEAVLNSNVVLEGAANIVPSAANQESLNNLTGSALFFRAFSLHELVKIYAKPYNKQTAATDLGIPIRLGSDVEIKSTRATVQEVYNQIIADLNEAGNRLPDNTSPKTKPSKAAAFGILSRVYMEMGDFEKSLENATKCLSFGSKLIDYNTVDTSQSSPFSRGNNEVIFDSFMANYALFILNDNLVDTLLYNSYEQNDLRRSAYFGKSGAKDHVFKGSYGGPPLSTYTLWSGVAMNEMFLNKAECLIRTGKTDEGIALLNQLLENRYKKGTYTPYPVGPNEQSLRYLLKERRKELLYRGIRFTDLRRLNQDNRFSVTLLRKLGDDLYELTPNDPRYVYPIPVEVIALTQMPQNQR